jgi:hypothetical protein
MPAIKPLGRTFALARLADDNGFWRNSGKSSEGWGSKSLSAGSGF